MISNNTTTLDGYAHQTNFKETSNPLKARTTIDPHPDDDGSTVKFEDLPDLGITQGQNVGLPTGMELVQGDSTGEEILEVQSQ